MKFEYFSHNGQLKPSDYASVPLSSIEYQYGFGVYETIRVTHGKSLFVDEHVDRLLESARIIGLEHEYSRELILESITALIERNGAEECNIKMLLIGGSTKEKANLYVLCLNPLFPEDKLYRDGVKCITAHFERALPRAKTLNMLQSYLAFRDAKKADAYDALLVNRDRNITEGTRTNILGIRGRTIITPPEDQILLGVTRKHVLDVAGEAGFDVKVEDMTLERIEDFTNLFLTSTSSKIMPIRQIDGKKLNAPSPELRELMAAFDVFLERKTP